MEVTRESETVEVEYVTLESGSDSVKIREDEFSSLVLSLLDDSLVRVTSHKSKEALRLLSQEELVELEQMPSVWTVSDFNAVYEMYITVTEKNPSPDSFQNYPQH